MSWKWGRFLFPTNFHFKKILIYDKITNKEGEINEI